MGKTTVEINEKISNGQLKSGRIEVQGKEVPTPSLSSYPRAVEIAKIFEEWIQKGGVSPH